MPVEPVITWTMRPANVRPDGAVSVHELLALVEGQREPVGALGVAPALGHRVEAEGRLPLGRELGVEPRVCFISSGTPAGVLGHLGERDVGVDDGRAPRPGGRSGAGGAATGRARGP